MAETISANHNAKLNFRSAFQKMLGVARDRNARWNKNESKDRDHDREEAVPLDADEVVLQRHDHEEAPEQSAVIAAAGGNERHVLAHGEEGDDGEENERTDAPDQDGTREDGAHLPPCADTCVEVVNCGVVGARLLAGAKDVPDDARNDQERDHAAKQPDEFWIAESFKHQAGPIRRRLLTASRARSRKASFSSSGAT